LEVNWKGKPIPKGENLNYPQLIKGINTPKFGFWEEGIRP